MCSRSLRDNRWFALRNSQPCANTDVITGTPPRLPALSAGPSQLVAQLALAPRRHAARIPFGQHRERVVIAQRESPHDSTTHPKRVQVAVLAGDRGLDARQVAARALDDVQRTVGRLADEAMRLGGSGSGGAGKSSGVYRTSLVCVLDRHEMRRVVRL